MGAAGSFDPDVALRLQKTSLIWDDHVGNGPRPDYDLNLLDRWRDVGITVASLNIGYDVLHWTDAIKNVAAFRRWFAMNGDRFLLVETALSGLDIAVVDGGVSVDADALVGKAVESGADFIAISTYNGVALRFCREVMDQLASRNVDIPIVVGGRLNEVPDDSNSGLPVDVTADLRKLGCHPCTTLDDILPMLIELKPRVGKG